MAMDTISPVMRTLARWLNLKPRWLDLILLAALKYDSDLDLAALLLKVQDARQQLLSLTLTEGSRTIADDFLNHVDQDVKHRVSMREAVLDCIKRARPLRSTSLSDPRASSSVNLRRHVL